VRRGTKRGKGGREGERGTKGGMEKRKEEGRGEDPDPPKFSDRSPRLAKTIYHH
jgi:hypothetical protein